MTLGTPAEEKVNLQVGILYRVIHLLQSFAYTFRSIVIHEKKIPMYSVIPYAMIFISTSAGNLQSIAK